MTGIGTVAAELSVSRDMASKWLGRFMRDRLAGLPDEPRPGRPRLTGDDRVGQGITVKPE